MNGKILKRPAVGSKVRVTVSNSYANRFLVGSRLADSVYIGTVLKSDEWMSDLSFNLSSDSNFHKVREIPLQTVISIEPIDDNQIKFDNVLSVAYQEWQILSSKKDTTYTVRVENGRWTCNCVANAYRKKVQCRHIAEAQGKI